MNFPLILCLQALIYSLYPTNSLLDQVLQQIWDVRVLILPNVHTESFPINSLIIEISVSGRLEMYCPSWSIACRLITTRCTLADSVEYWTLVSESEGDRLTILMCYNQKIHKNFSIIQNLSLKWIYSHTRYESKFLSWSKFWIQILIMI